MEHGARASGSVTAETTRIDMRHREDQLVLEREHDGVDFRFAALNFRVPVRHGPLYPSSTIRRQSRFAGRTRPRQIVVGVGPTSPALHGRSEGRKAQVPSTCPVVEGRNDMADGLIVSMARHLRGRRAGARGRHYDRYTSSIKVPEIEERLGSLLAGRQDTRKASLSREMRSASRRSARAGHCHCREVAVGAEARPDQLRCNRHPFGRSPVSAGGGSWHTHAAVCPRERGYGSRQTYWGARCGPKVASS